MSALLAGRISDNLHDVPDAWIGARVPLWMFSETPGAWWVMSYTHDGKMVSAAYRPGHTPSFHKMEFAARVCRHVNKHAGNGGVWLAGFIDKDRPEQFYLLFKDGDGDIHIPIEFPFAFETLLGWKIDSFALQAHYAWEMWAEHHRNMEYRKGQQVSLAQQSC